MTSEEWWTRWSTTWYAVGWRIVAARSNFNVDEVLDICAALLMRVARLESKADRTPFFGLF